MEKELLLAIREMLKEELKPLKDEIKDVKTEISSMKSKVDETYEIVKTLEHLVQGNKAEHDQMKNDIAHIRGNIETIKRNMYRIEEATANNWADIARLKQAK